MSPTRGKASCNTNTAFQSQFRDGKPGGGFELPIFFAEMILPANWTEDPVEVQNKNT